MEGKVSGAETSIPDWQPIIKPDKPLFSISVCETMTKATEAYQTRAENPMTMKGQGFAVIIVMGDKIFWGEAEETVVGVKQSDFLGS